MPSFGEAFQTARPWRVIRTRRSKPCILHSEPGPEMWEDENGVDHPVTEMEEQWDPERVSLVVRETYVGTCHTAGREPGLPGSERWLRPTAPAPEPAPDRTDSHAERPPEPKVGPRPTPPLFWVL